MSMHVRASGDRYHHHLSSGRSSISRDIKAVCAAIHHNSESFERVPCDVESRKDWKGRLKNKKWKRTRFKKEKKKEGQPDQGQPKNPVNDHASPLLLLLLLLLLSSPPSQLPLPRVSHPHARAPTFTKNHGLPTWWGIHLHSREDFLRKTG